MALTPDQITIAVTVYDRRDYILQAVASALDQTRPVRVLVVEDCGPDRGLRALVESRFGARVDYRRNPQRRGLFDNWNACVEACETAWLSILHDDDWLEAGFVQTMFELDRQAPGRDLYFGETKVVNQAGQTLASQPTPTAQSWRAVDLTEAALASPFPFPGQLMRVEAVRALGGFRAMSRYTGDWEMWFRLAAHGGAAQAMRTVANFRQHRGAGRGTVRVERTGELYGWLNVQRKRNLAALRQSGRPARFDRQNPRCQAPWVSSLLLRCGHAMTPRMVRYNLGLLVTSPPARPWMMPYRALARLGGSAWVRLASRLWRACAGPGHAR
ncbi:MAG: glycosyltransferase family 2 protein [Verrucomicrobia bacterium]|nr:glycosyltransferase family 2 protein [Verrucomicrobiota bacterium]